MKHFTTIILALFFAAAGYSQCERLKKRESKIFNTISYKTDDMRLGNAGGDIGGFFSVFAMDEVQFQVILPVSQKTCWDTEKSAITIQLASGEELELPFAEANNDCDDISPYGVFSISDSHMEKLAITEATQFTVHYKSYAVTYQIPEKVNDDLADPDVKDFPRKRLMKSIGCLIDIGF